jgi:hypothetical protein
MEKKFKILRIVAFLWKILAWVILVISLLGACGSLVLGFVLSDQLARTSSGLGISVSVVGGPLGALVTALVVTLIGIFYFLSLYAVAEMIDVMLALEENTRATAEQSKNIAKS